MRKKTYKALIFLAIVVVIFSIALAIGIQYRQHIALTGRTGLFTSQQTTTAITEKTNPVIPENSTFEIHFFDVGEADSALVECDGHYMLIDGGNPGSSSFLYSYLQHHKIDYLDYVVCSHAHTDHAGGLAGALNYASVGTAYAPVMEYDSRAFSSFVKYLQAQGKEVTIPSSGDTVMLGSAKISFLGPIDMSIAEQNHNNASIILRIEYGSTSFLFTGDAEIEEEQSLIGAGLRLQSTLLKVGHHGSNTSSSEEFLTKVKPEYAIISVGKDNEYGHPHNEAIERILKFCSLIYRTDTHGEIICRSDGEQLSFDFSHS